VALAAPPETDARVPPHNLEAESSVLGAILLSEHALDPVLIDVGLRPEDFYRERHRHIFRAMIRLKERIEPSPVDTTTVAAELESQEVLDQVGGRDYVQVLPNLVPAAGNAAHYARIVKGHSLERRLLDATREIQERVFRAHGDPRELIEEAEAKLFQVGHDDGTGEVRAIGDVLYEEVDRLERLSRESIALTGTPSGFRDLDDLTGGFQPGNLIVLAARPSMGKSALVVNMAENAALDHGRAVALFSLEMAEAELAQRFIASCAKLNGDDLRKGRVKPDSWPKVVRATEQLAAAPLYVDDSSDLGILDLRAKARRLHSKHPLGLIIVDYLQLMRHEGGREASRVEQVGQFSRGLKILARELGVPVIAVSQLSRAVESRPDKKPMLSDLRESGQIEQDADLVMMIYRDDYYHDEESERPGEADVIVAKHRNGPVGSVALAFMKRFPKFANLYREPVLDGASSADGGG
jgi:replicative DNA helicase